MLFGRLWKCTPPNSADVDDSQEKPTSDSCKVNCRSVKTSSPTIREPHVSEPQLSVTADDVFNVEEQLRDGSLFQDKCVNSEQQGKPGREPIPEGRGGGYIKHDSVTRSTADASSVWDSFDVSAIRESQESLPCEFVHLFVACYLSRFVYSRLF